LSTIESPVRAAASAREALLQRFAIEVDRESGTVTYILGGASRAQFIKEANQVTQDLYGRRAVSELSLSRWSNDPRYLESSAPREIVTIQGVAPDSTGLTRTEQAELGLNNAPTRDVVVGHIAYMVATGEDLFKRLHTRTDSGVLKLYRDGLHLYTDFVDAPYPDVGASKRLNP
jgi:hypothetical protein